ncbi:unnamed protein product [Leptosia nina]|uniref:Uncharacterized protein n=1 Tax=Leptosia nina TaxID=320188 RepID=A0AAV1K3R9_9NEOP
MLRVRRSRIYAYGNRNRALILVEDVTTASDRPFLSRHYRPARVSLAKERENRAPIGVTAAVSSGFWEVASRRTEEAEGDSRQRCLRCIAMDAAFARLLLVGVVQTLISL